MALRGSGSAVHSTALMRLYSGRVRFSSVTKARTVCSLSGSQQMTAPIFLPISLTTHSLMSAHLPSSFSNSSGLTFSPLSRMMRFFLRPVM